MNKIVIKILLGVGIALITIGLYGIYFTIRQDGFQENQALKELLAGAEGALRLNPQTKSANCKLRGALPDPGCSPGAIFTDATKEEICVSGYTKTVRNVSASLKKKVYQEYGIDYHQPFGSYEIDHIIPLAIGGNNDIANLFPEAAEPNPGFKEKDLVEVYLREEVCAGHVALSVAQQKVATDWLEIYNNFSEGKIKDLQSRYKNWAN